MFTRFTTIIWKTMYWPICRAYARRVVGDKPADSVMAFMCSIYFFTHHGYWPNFKRPHSFQEKLWHRMLFDRDPRWTLFSDRLRARDYVAVKAGGEHLVPLLWKGSNPEDIPFSKLPGKFVIKTNHGCGYNILVRDKARFDQGEAKRQLKKWLGENFCQDTYLGTPWGYKNITPMIMVEAFLGNGKAPEDYKFFCFSGRAEYCKVDFDRFEDHSELFFDRDRNPIEFYGKGIKHYQGNYMLPDNYREMVEVAERLAQGIDFIRVDLYNVEGHIYFGELTCYHGGGMIRIEPREYDFIFGEKWKYGEHGQQQV